MLKIADLIDKNRDEVARIESMDMGKPLREAEGDVDDALHCYRYYAGLIKAPYGGVYDVNEGFGKMHSFTIHEPVGVVALISAWNFPFVMGSWKIAPALAAGNSIIFKPASNAVMSNVKMFEILEEAGVPKGAANLILGPGGSVGEALASHKDIGMVTLTGSTAVGQSIMRCAASNVKKIGLELGGKSPNIIFADVDLEAAVEWAMIGIFFNQGEVCSANSRLLVQHSVKDQMVEKLVARAAATQPGDPLDPASKMGAMVDARHTANVMRFVETGKKTARLVAGGEQVTVNGRGSFVQPTIFDNVSPNDSIARDEIFGPVLSVIAFDDEDEAVRIANDSVYGLAASLWTDSLSRAHRIAGRLHAGTVSVNTVDALSPMTPFGGFKQSGFGRDLSLHALDKYTALKTTWIKY